MLNMPCAFALDVCALYVDAGYVVDTVCALGAGTVHADVTLVVTCAFALDAGALYAAAGHVVGVC